VFGSRNSKVDLTNFTRFIVVFNTCGIGKKKSAGLAMDISVRCDSHLIIQDLIGYLRSSNYVISALSKNIKDRVRITFSFNLYAVPLLVTLVVYFRSGL